MIEDKTDYIVYIIAQLIISYAIIHLFDFTKISGLILSVSYATYPSLTYIRYYGFRYIGLRFMEVEFRDTEMNNIRKVLDRKRKSSMLDKVYFITYLMFILFGVGLVIFGK